MALALAGVKVIACGRRAELLEHLVAELGAGSMAVTVDLLNQGQLTVTELNRMAGFVMNPLDVVGVAIILSAAKQLNTVVRAAILASLFGTLVRMAMHMAIF